MQALIVADDLTGANEAAAAFAIEGLETEVRFLATLPDGRADETERPPEGADVIVIDTETRNLDGPATRARLSRLLGRIPGWRPAVIYGKIDSTLRGPVGAEVDALMGGLGLERAVVVPAFPAQGRTTVAGHQLVYGVPVQYTPAGQDPVTPARHSHIPRLLERETGREALSLTLEVVQQGPEAVAAGLQECFTRAPICVVDVATEVHLATVGQALGHLGPEVLRVGTAGLARYLARSLAGRLVTPHRAGGSTAELFHEGLLVVCGSRHPVSLHQVDRLRKSVPLRAYRLARVDGPLLRLSEAGDEPVPIQDDLSRELSAALQEGHVLLLSPEEPQGSGRETGLRIAGEMARLVREAAGHVRPRALLLTGGETAFHVLQATGADSLRMSGFVSDGVPVGTVQGGLCAGLSIVTKAGGFGAPDALLVSFRHLQQQPPEAAGLPGRVAGPGA